MLAVLRPCALAVALRAAAPLAIVAVAAPSMAATAPSDKAYVIDPTRLAGLGDFIDGVMAQQIASHDVAGAVVTVVHRGKVILSRGYGYQDFARNIPVDARQTLFRPGSVSKLFTWTALMQLVEAGKIDLDADVNHYLDFKIPDFNGKPIKVRDLMTHTAGFGDQSDIFAEKQSDLIGFDNWMKKHVATRVRPPGEESQYSNYGVALAGYIIERVSGQAFPDYAEQHIFQPLGMVDTTFREPLAAPQAARMAKGYRLENGQMKEQDFEWISDIGAAGSTSATAPDMARFIQMLLNGGSLGKARILSPESVKFLTADGFRNAPHLPGFAHGFMVFREGGPRMVDHGGNTGDQHSFLLIAPEADFGFFVSETGGPGSTVGRTELVQAVVGRLFPTERAPRYTGAGALPPMGYYRTNRLDYSKPADPKWDIKVSAVGDHAVITEQGGKSLYWQQIGPRLYEQVTNARDGGPFEQMEFYGSAEDPRLSFSSQPHVLYRLMQNKAY